MRLLVILEDFSMGGVEKVTLNLVKGLTSIYGDSIICLVKSGAGPLQEDFSNACDILMFDGSIVSGISQLKRTSLSWKPDVVLSTKGGLTRYALAIKIFFPTAKLVSVQHVPIKLPGKNKFYSAIRSIAAACLYRAVDAVVAVSEGIRNDLINGLRMNEEKIIRIYNPVIDFERMNLQHLYPPIHGDYFIAIGRLSYQKGFDYLIESVAIVKKNHFNVSVKVLGDGPLMADLKREVCQRGLQDNIEFLGEVDDPYSYLKFAKGLVLTSRWEGLPTVMVEAAYMGTQSIAFDCQFGPKELTSNGSHGYLCEMGNVSEVARSMISVIVGGSKDLPDITEFTIEGASKTYRNLFMKLCGFVNESN